MSASILAPIYAHPTISALIAYYIGSAFTASLPAPTKTSSQFYVFVFQFVNTLAANLARAYKTKVENSPNWQDAVKLHIEKEGTENGHTSSTDTTK